MNVLCELARKNPRDYLPLAPQLFHLLTTSSNNWMLIKIIKLVSLGELFHNLNLTCVVRISLTLRAALSQEVAVADNRSHLYHPSDIPPLRMCAYMYYRGHARRDRWLRSCPNLCLQTSGFYSRHGPELCVCIKNCPRK